MQDAAIELHHILSGAARGTMITLGAGHRSQTGRQREGRGCSDEEKTGVLQRQLP